MSPAGEAVSRSVGVLSSSGGYSSGRTVVGTGRHYIQTGTVSRCGGRTEDPASFTQNSVFIRLIFFLAYSWKHRPP